MSVKAPKKVVVVGGGIAGLSTAWHIRRLAACHGIELELRLLEASSVVGGNIRSEWVSTALGDFLVEWGPNGVLDNKPETLELCDALGLSDDVIEANEAAAKRYLFLDGRLQQLPTSPGAFMKSPILPIGARWRVMREPFIKGLSAEGESVFGFAERRLGHHAASRLIDPFVSGIFAGDPKLLSVHAAFPRLTEMERAHGSLFRAQKAMKRERVAAGEEVKRPVLHSLRHGMGQLTTALGADLGSVVHTETRVERIRRFEDGWVVDIQGAPPITEVDHVILATPTYATAGIVGGLERAFLSPLQAIDYAAVTVVAMGFAADAVGNSLDGFGFLVPSLEEREILGCLWPSSIYPGHRAPDDTKLLRVMVGGARNPKLALRADSEILSSVKSELAEILGLQGEPIFERVIRWKSAIPQYSLQHLEHLRQLDAVVGKWPGLSLVGNGYRGVAVNDCTREAPATARSVLGLTSDA